MNPAQRIRRSRWQLGLVGTVAAGLILTVFLTQIPRGEDSAMEATPNRGVGAPQASAPSPSDLMAKAEVPQSFGAESSNGADSIDNQMLVPLAPGAAAPLASADVAATEVSPLASEYTNFISFDVSDPEVGLQQMQSVLASNKMAPIEIFEQDDSPVVVLSGDVKKLAEVLEAFQAAGDNSLSLLAKVGPDSNSFTGRNLGEQSFGDASADSPMADAPRLGENVMANDSNQVAGAVAAPPLPSSSSDVVSNLAMGSEQEIPPPGSVGVPNTGQAQTPMAAAGLSQNIPSFNSRQEIIRGQVNVLTNSMAPSSSVTLEDFLNERPAPNRARVPFPGQNRVQSQQLVPVPPADATASQVVEPVFGAGAPAASTMKIDPSGQQSRGETGSDATSQQSIMAGPVGQIPAPIREAVESRTTETMPSTANVVSTNQKPTQIVVILRPKARGQQMPASTGQQP
jgi:hypothetical protein